MIKQLVKIAFLSVCILSTACTSSRTQESTGQFIDSAGITMKVKSKLVAEESIKGLAISVKTYKNSVMLSGFVDNQEQKQTAVNIARHVKGVTSVTDALVIKPH